MCCGHKDGRLWQKSRTPELNIYKYIFSLNKNKKRPGRRFFNLSKIEILAIISRMEQIDLFNIKIHNVTMDEAVSQIRTWVQSGQGSYVVTPNVDHIVKLQNDLEFQEIYREAGLVIADGMPLVWVSRWAQKGLKDRVTGADLFLEVCADAELHGMTVYLLGAASQEIIEATSSNLKLRYPCLKIVGSHSPSFGFENKEEENEVILGRILKAKPDILFVGVGAPKQEKWIGRFQDRLGGTVSLGVGAAFDFVAGSVKRAPVWMRKTGLEWFFRFLKEPRRMFKRYFIDDFVFFKLALKELWKRK